MPKALVDGVVVDVTDQEVAETQYQTEKDKVQSLRNFRDRLLEETDVWALADRTMTAEQTAYRQALRDIPDQAGFPTTITWPTKP